MATIVLKCNKKVKVISTPSSYEQLVSIIKEKFNIKDSKPKIIFKDEDDDKYPITDQLSYQDFLTANEELKKIKAAVIAKKFYEPSEEKNDDSDDDSVEEKPKPKPKKKDDSLHSFKKKEEVNNENNISDKDKNLDSPLMKRIDSLEKSNYELKKSIEDLSQFITNFISKVDKNSQDINTLLQNQSVAMSNITNSVIMNQEIINSIRNNLDEVTKIVKNQSAMMLNNSLPSIGNPTMLKNDKPIYKIYNTISESGTNFHQPNQEYSNPLAPQEKKLYTNSNDAHKEKTPFPQNSSKEDSIFKEDVSNPGSIQMPLSFSKLPSASQLKGNQEESTSTIKPKGEYNSLIHNDITVSEEQVQKEEFYITLIISNNGTLPWPENTMFKMARANQKIISIEDIKLKDGTVAIGETVYVKPKAKLLSKEKCTKYNFQGYIFNKEIGVIGKICSLTISVLESVATIVIKEDKKEEQNNKPLTQETIDKIYKKLCDDYDVDNIFVRDDIINAIKKSNGDPNRAQKILFD